MRANDPRIRPLIPRDAIIRYYSQKARRVRRSAVSLRAFLIAFSDDLRLCATIKLSRPWKTTGDSESKEYNTKRSRGIRRRRRRRRIHAGGCRPGCIFECRSSTAGRKEYTSRWHSSHIREYNFSWARQSFVCTKVSVRIIPRFGRAEMNFYLSREKASQ